MTVIFINTCKLIMPQMLHASRHKIIHETLFTNRQFRYLRVAFELNLFITVSKIMRDTYTTITLRNAVTRRRKQFKVSLSNSKLSLLSTVTDNRRFGYHLSVRRMSERFRPSCQYYTISLVRAK